MSTNLPTPADIEAALADFPDPETGRPALKMQQIRDIQVEGSEVSLTVALSTHSAPLWSDVQQRIEERLRTRVPALSSVHIQRAVHNRPPQKLGEIGLTVKSVIAIGSGKGGVGKSTVAASLAFALHQAGCKVGLMDADVYGPSIPHLTGTSDQTQIGAQGQKLMPARKDGMPIMSIGYLVPPDQAVIWRGPMLHSAVMQFLRGTEWGELDYLIIDMPPGTGDIALSLSQALPLAGAVVVCTPQEVALLDAVKAIAMFRKVNIPVLGMVENMSGFLCPDNGKRYDIFGHGGARKKAAELNVPFLGELPIVLQIRERGDEGETSQNLADPLVAPYLEKIAFSLVKHLADTAAEEPPRPSLPVLG
jgi:ATP-binding protein involved in chromosome partitioning